MKRLETMFLFTLHGIWQVFGCTECYISYICRPYLVYCSVTDCPTYSKCGIFITIAGTTNPRLTEIMVLMCDLSFLPHSVSSEQKTPEKKVESKPKPKSRPKPADNVPFNRIMEGVVFVLSGFQNPFRGELRDKALAMGARYRPDWTPDSTHLM